MAFTEELLLPSRGIIYRLQNFDGTVKVKPFTTKAYKDLLAANASETGLRQFIDSCLVDCPVKAKDMNQEDLLAALFKARVMTLGNTLKMQVRCPECKHVEDLEWDLNSIEINYLYVDKYPIPVTFVSQLVLMLIVQDRKLIVVQAYSKNRLLTSYRSIQQWLYLTLTVRTLLKRLIGMKGLIRMMLFILMKCSQK